MQHISTWNSASGVSVIFPSHRTRRRSLVWSHSSTRNDGESTSTLTSSSPSSASASSSRPRPQPPSPLQRCSRIKCHDMRGGDTKASASRNDASIQIPLRPRPRLLQPAVASALSLALAFSTLEASMPPLPQAKAESLLSFDFLKKDEAGEEKKATAGTSKTAATAAMPAATKTAPKSLFSSSSSPSSAAPAPSSTKKVSAGPPPPSATKKKTPPPPSPTPLGRPPAVAARNPSKKDAEALLKREREKEKREKELEAENIRQKAAAEKAEREAKARARQAKQQQQQALIGGGAAALAALFAAKWQVVATAIAVLFRNIGGPSLISAILRSPGTIFGRVIRSLKWDPSASSAPINSASAEFGPLRTLRLRAQTPEGLAAAISKAELAEKRARRKERERGSNEGGVGRGRGVSLSGSWSSTSTIGSDITVDNDDGDDGEDEKEGRKGSEGGARNDDDDNDGVVAAMAHWVPTPSPGFLEPITSAAAIALLPDPAFVVWVSKKDVLEYEAATAGAERGGGGGGGGGGKGEPFSFPTRGGKIASSTSSSSSSSSSPSSSSSTSSSSSSSSSSSAYSAAALPGADGAPVSTAREALAELAAALEGEEDEAAVLAAASLEPAPFVALHRALYSASIFSLREEQSEAEVELEAMRRRQRLVKAAREVVSRQSRGGG